MLPQKRSVFAVVSGSFDIDLRPQKVKSALFHLFIVAAVWFFVLGLMSGIS